MKRFLALLILFFGQTSSVWAGGIADEAVLVKLGFFMLVIIIVFLVGYIVRLHSVVETHTRDIRDTEARFTALFEGNQCVQLVIDPENAKIIEANQAAENFYGYTRDQLLSMKITDINTLPPEEIAKRLQKVQALGAPKAFQFEHKLADGRIRQVEAYANLLNWGDKTVVYTIIFDITPRWEAKKQAHKFEQVVEHAGQSVMITDKHGVVEYVNPAYLKLTGFSLDEAIGRVPSVFRDKNEEVWAVLQSGNTWHGKMCKHRTNGDEYLAMVTVSCIFDGKGQVQNTVILQTDLSEHQRLEQQLQQAQKMEAIGTLVGGIAHDFNNMLAGMVGNLYLAKKQVVDQPKLEEKLNNIEQLSFKAAKMIEHLLTFARKGHISMQPLCLNHMLQDSITLFEAVVPESIALTYDVCEQPLNIEGDATQLEQVLMNLVSNAQDALEAIANPRIYIHLESFLPSDDFLQDKPYFEKKAYAKLCVQDNGMGIPQDKLDILFEPFFTTKEQGKGTGLGLSMVFGAVKTHQGYIEVESQVGEGATFYIYLPLIADEVEAQHAQQKALDLGGHQETLLLVDDEKHIIQTGREVLESLGYNVLVAKDGLDAVGVFQEHASEIDLVITDIVMPNLGGIEAIEQMRKIKPELKVIFSTGYDSSSAWGSHGLLQHESVITKPYQVKTLAEMIQDKLQ